MPANNEEIQEGKDETENEAKGGISGCGVQPGPVTSPFKVPLKGGAVTDRRVAPSDAEAAHLHRSDPQHSQQPRRAAHAHVCRDLSTLHLGLFTRDKERNLKET